MTEGPGCWSTGAVPPTRGDDAAAGCSRRRAALDGQVAVPRLTTPDDDATLWFVTVTLAGDAVELSLVRAALERLAVERPFVVSARYGAGRAEVRYWDECDDAEVATAQALRMWSDHEVSAGLPAWRVVGLEVHDRASVHLHWERTDRPRVEVLGEVRPFDAV
jgi:hypothetical protein